MKRAPGFTLAAVATLALGLGIGSAVVSLANALFLKPLPIDGSVGRRHRRSDGSGPPGLERCSHSYPDYVYYRDHARAFSDLAAHYSTSPMQVVTPGGAFNVSGSVVTANYFSLLRLQPAMGRFFSADEDRVPGAHPVAVLGYDLWRTEFARDARILGASVRINGTTFHVIGIAPEGFRGTLGGVTPNDVWIPTAMFSVGYRYCDGRARGCRVVNLIGRLAPRSSIEDAQAEMNVLAGQLAPRSRDQQGARRAGSRRPAASGSKTRRGKRRSSRCWREARRWYCSSRRPTSQACCSPAGCAAGKRSRSGAPSAPAAAASFVCCWSNPSCWLLPEARPGSSWRSGPLTCSAASSASAYVGARQLRPVARSPGRAPGNRRRGGDRRGHGNRARASGDAARHVACAERRDAWRGRATIAPARRVIVVQVAVSVVLLAAAACWSAASSCCTAGWVRSRCRRPGTDPAEPRGLHERACLDISARGDRRLEALPGVVAASPASVPPLPRGPDPFDGALAGDRVIRRTRFGAETSSVRAISRRSERCRVGREFDDRETRKAAGGHRERDARAPPLAEGERSGQQVGSGRTSAKWSVWSRICNSSARWSRRSRWSTSISGSRTGATTGRRIRGYTSGCPATPGHAARNPAGHRRARSGRARLGRAAARRALD